MQNQFKKGFTLIEMIVVVSIISIIFSILLGNKSFSEKLNLKNQSYKVVLYLRQAQVQSLGVQGFVNNSSQTTFDVSYGLSVGTVSSNKISFFTDANLNGIYDTGETHEDYTFNNGISINKVCGVNSSGNEKCSGNSAVDRVDIAFKRPNPRAIVNFLNNGSNSPASLSAPVSVYLSSPSGFSTVIRVETTGGVSIQ